MDKRQGNLIGIAAGLVWAVALLVLAAVFVRLPVFTLIPTIMIAFLAPGLVMAAMAGRLALRRLRAAPGIAAGTSVAAKRTDVRVLRDTVEQMVLALAVWPAAAVMLGAVGPGTIVVLGAGLALARLAFWAGCHHAPALAAFGFAASFCPTVLVALWALWEVAV